MSGDVTEQSSSKHCSSNQVKTLDSPPPNSSSASSANRTVPPLDASVLIKREPEPVPEPEDPPSLLTGVVPETTPYSKSDGHGELKQRLSTRTDSSSSKWTGTEDELTLTAYDVIAGVINTHPIQPLEQDATDNTKVSSASPPSSSKKGKDNHSITPTISDSTATATSASCSVSSFTKKKEQHSLVKDLDEFSKVMHQVTQEQIEKERRVSLGAEVETPIYPNQSSDSLLPYRGGMGQSHPNNFRHKYLELQAPPSSRSQVNSTYQPNTATKSQLILPSLNDPPASNGNHLPVTPTTPLEHFSAFQLPLTANDSPVLHSPQPCPSHPHLPLAATASPVLRSPQACPPPPPYSSTATGICYPYNGTYLTSGSSEHWPHPSQSVQLQQHAIDTQDGLKDNILSRVSSCVVALAGRKRHNCEVNVLPPAKRGVLGPHTSGSLHRYPDNISTPYPTATPPYPNAYTGGASSCFPH